MSDLTFPCTICKTPATVEFVPASDTEPAGVENHPSCECGDHPAVIRAVYDRMMNDRAIEAFLNRATD